VTKYRNLYLYATTALVTLAVTSGATAQDKSKKTIGEIIVTAQRTEQRLQDVPIAVSAFDASALEEQQLHNASALQYALPSVVFSKNNFTSFSLSIRGIGYTGTGATADPGVGIHYEEVPIGTPRLFETEFFDIERVEVLRGPQGTLYGRNSTGGAVNLVAKKPTDEFSLNSEVGVGNYGHLQISGALNIPLSDTLGVRFSGIYLNRDGYSYNQYSDKRIDDRDQWAVRATMRWQPSSRTNVDVILGYFKEEDSRVRAQRTQCVYDTGGIFGCMPGKRGNEQINAYGTFDVLASRQFFVLNGIPDSVASLIGLVDLSNAGGDGFAGKDQPEDLRTIDSDIHPKYRTGEKYAILKAQHEFDPVTVKLSASYHEAYVLSQENYYRATQNPLSETKVATMKFGLGLLGLTNAVDAFFGDGVSTYISQVEDGSLTGIYGGNKFSSPQPTQYDQSNTSNYTYFTEVQAQSTLEGPLNFLVGANYLNSNSLVQFHVTTTSLDYASLVLGGLQSSGAGGGATPFYINDTDLYELTSKAIYGEVYYDITPELKLTVGARYTSENKYSRARQLLILGGILPFGATSYDESALFKQDQDPRTMDYEPFAILEAKFEKATGRVVLDWKPELSFTDSTMVYASYSRGFKGGGMNPPQDPALDFADVPQYFSPETVNAFEIGTKNTLLDGRLQANLTAFYYDYKGMQVSKIFNRSAHNVNTDATIYGVEAEFIYQVADPLVVNASASYIKSKIKDLEDFNPRNPGAGREDVVTIRDISSAALCVVESDAQSLAATSAFVNYVNANIVPNGATSFSTVQTVNHADGSFAYNGAYSVCSALQGAAANTTLQALFGNMTVSGGINQDLSGNQLPNAPKVQFSLGAQYTMALSENYNAVFRGDYNYTGSQYSGTNFNTPEEKLDGYSIVNLSATVSPNSDRWYLRAYVSNLLDKDALTGLYSTDQTSGLFYNAFLSEPRRYGIAFGFNY